MNSNTPAKTAKATLHLLCGKIASGKSTLADKLSASPGTITLSENLWLAALYAEETQSVADYVRCAAKLKGAMKPHLVSLLQSSVSVVLDFPANTRANRDWMMGIVEASGADNRLHYLNVSDDIYATEQVVVRVAVAIKAACGGLALCTGKSIEGFAEFAGEDVSVRDCWDISIP